MQLDVVREVDDAQLAELRDLIEAARTNDHHDPLGEHKWLDLVHGGRRTFAGVVAREGDDVIGYAHLSGHATGNHAHWGLEIVVHPSHRNRDVEQALVEAGLQLARDEGGGHLHLWVFQPGEVHDRLAAELGLTKGRDLLHMKVALPLPEGPDFPPDVELRHFEPGRDEQAWLDVNNRAFDHHPEQGAWDRDTLDRRMAEDWFDPEGFILAERNGELVGFCWTKRNPHCGEIYVIGVDPAHHGGGLGRALVIAGLNHLVGTGATTGCLYVDAAEEAPVSMYGKLGFTTDHMDRAYVIDL